MCYVFLMLITLNVANSWSTTPTPKEAAQVDATGEGETFTLPWQKKKKILTSSQKATSISKRPIPC